MDEVKKRRILQIVMNAVKEDGTIAGELFEAISYGVGEYAKRMRQIATDRDKAILALRERTCYKNPKMLEDVARVLSESVFNGQEKVYTLEETADILRLSKSERKKVLPPKHEDKRHI